MTPSEIIIAITLHLLVPAMGVMAYAIICRRLLAKGASPMFLAQLFLLFVCYGGALLVFLTSLFWKWSGMASLGTFFLMLAAPILLAPVTFSLWKQQDGSLTHRVAFLAAILGCVELAVLILMSRRVKLLLIPSDRMANQVCLCGVVASSESSMKLSALASPELKCGSP